MKLADIMRLPEGSVYYIETADGNPKTMQRATGNVKAYACQCDAKAKTSIIRGFDNLGCPVYLVRIEILKQGREKMPRGRKAKKESSAGE
jgi:hypothetical protein